jgi:pilus assembly protein CpaF
VNRSLAIEIRELVAEDLAGTGAVGLAGDHRREFARQRIFVHLDRIAHEAPEWSWPATSDPPVTPAELLAHGPAPGRIASAQSRSGAESAKADAVLAQSPATGLLPIDPAEEQALAQSILDALFGMGGLQRLIDDPEIENIDINGCDRVWVTYADGSKRLMDAVADSDDEVIEMVRTAASRFGLAERRFDLARPEVDLRLPDGSRLSALMAVTARPAVSIRRHRYSALTLSDLVGLGTVSEDVATLLAAAVRARKNIVVSGAMNAGKTTLLRALAAEVPPRERIVTIEQALELGLDADRIRHPDMVALEARPANVEGEGLIAVSDLVRRALRMNADRVIVGEVLGDEVLPMLNAMSQGRSGSMCTIHADSSAGVFRRIASYGIQAPERLPLEASNLLIAGAVHFVVHLDTEAYEEAHEEESSTELDQRRARRDDGRSDTPGWDLAGCEYFPAVVSRRRFVSSIREVVDAEGPQVISNEIFRPGADRRAVTASPLRLETVEELRRYGYQPSGPGSLGMPA